MKILVVDDSKAMRHVLITQLKELGYDSFIEADCVDKAKLLCSGDRPSLVISDWNMPNASGLDLLKFIRNNNATRDVPFIMLTTETDRNKIIEATRAGLQSYLLKPIRKNILIEKMRELSTAYGFTPPIDNKAQIIIAADPVKAEVHPLKGKIKKDQIPKFLELYCKVWLNECSIESFEEFLAIEILGDPAKAKPDDISLFMKTILHTAQTAVEYKLNELSE